MPFVTYSTGAAGRIAGADFKPTPTKKQGLPFWKKLLSSGPVAGALDFVTRPAYAVGGLIAGKPGAAFAEIAPLIPFVGQAAWLADQKWDSIIPDRKKILPGQALAARGVLPKHGVLGGLSKFAADVALDPTTYVTFGVGGAAKKAAQQAGSVALKEALDTAAKQGRVLTHAEKARITGDVAAAIAAAPKPLEIGIALPFTRKSRILASSERGARAIKAPFAVVGGTRIGTGVQKIVRPGGTANPVVKAVWRGVQEISQRDKNDLTRRLKALADESFKLDKAIGQKRGYIAERIAFHLDNPTVHALPEGLDEFAPRVMEIRDELQQLALDSGLLSQKDLLDSYLPHLAADPKTASKLRGRFGKPSADNPFFTRHRHPNLKTLDDWIANGLKPETNVFKLLQVRGHQAIDAMASRTAKDEIVRQFGAKGGLRELPDVAAAERALADAEAELAALSSKALGPRGVSNAAARVRQVAAERAAAARTPGVAGSVGRLRASQVPYPTPGIAAINQARQVADTLADEASKLLSKRHLTAQDGVALGRRLEELHGRAAGPLGVKSQITPTIPGTNAATAVSGTQRNIPAQGRTELVGLTAAQSKAYNDVIDHVAYMRRLLAQPNINRREILSVGRKLEAARARVRALDEAANRQINVARRGVGAGTAPRVRASARQSRTFRETFNPQQSPLQIAQDELAFARAQAATGVSAGTAAQVSAARGRRDTARTRLLARQKRYEQAKAHNDAVMASPAKFADPEGWKQIQQDWVKLRAELEGLVPPEIAQDLAFVMDDIRRAIDSPAAVYDAANFFNRLGSNWKALAILSPGFHFRNAFDDTLRGFFAGARNPLSYIQAGKIISGKDANARLLIDGRRMSGKQIAAEAEALGVVDHGIIGYEIRNQAELAARNRLRPSRLGEGGLTSGSRRVGTWRENTFRLGTYIDLRKQGMSALEAAERVKTHHFDYGDVSVLVGRARRFWLPFITYASKATPYFARQLVQRPGQAAAINKAMIELGDASAIDIDPSLLSVGQKLSVPLPFFGSEENPLMLNPEGVAYFTAPQLFDPGEIQRQFIAKAVNPLARSPVEAATGYSFYRGRRVPEVVRAPDWIQRLQDVSGIDVPGFVPTDAEKPYRDVLTREPKPGVRSVYDVIYRNLPAYSQSDLITGGAAGDWKFGATKYMFGLPVYRFDRARAQSLADFFARRNQ